MEAFSASLDFCAGNSPVAGEFHSKMSVTRSFDVFFDLRLNKRLSKQSRRRWFETPSRSLWRHCIGMFNSYHNITRWAAVQAAIPSSISQGSVAINAIPVIAANPATHDTLYIVATVVRTDRSTSSTPVNTKCIMNNMDIYEHISLQVYSLHHNYFQIRYSSIIKLIEPITKGKSHWDQHTVLRNLW